MRLQVERLSVQSSRVIVELQQEAEIQYLRPKLEFDGQCFYPSMYRRNQAAKFQFSPSYIEGKGFCPATLGFLMYLLFMHYLFPFFSPQMRMLALYAPDVEFYSN